MSGVSEFFLFHFTDYTPDYTQLQNCLLIPIEKCPFWGGGLKYFGLIKNEQRNPSSARFEAKTKFSRRIPLKNRTREKLSINKAFLFPSFAKLDTRQQQQQRSPIFFHFLFSPESGMGKILIVNSFRLLFVGHKRRTMNGHTFSRKKAH